MEQEGKVIPISELKKFAKQYGYDHVIVFATAGEMQYIATYGHTLEECDRAAQFGDKMKDALGWPESLHAIPFRVHALQTQIADLKYYLKKAGISTPYDRVSQKQARTINDAILEKFLETVKEDGVKEGAILVNRIFSKLVEEIPGLIIQKVNRTLKNNYRLTMSSDYVYVLFTADDIERLNNLKGSK